MNEIYVRMLDQAIFEVGEGFKGLEDAHVWQRPAEGLLSVGEIAGHMAYWQAIRLAGEGEDLSKCKIASPLVDRRFRYFPGTLEELPTEQHLAMTADQVWSELSRVHAESVASLKALDPDPAAKVAGMGDWTWQMSIEYLLFHIAYHTGQIYTARHLLGETPPDN